MLHDSFHLTLLFNGVISLLEYLVSMGYSCLKFVTKKYCFVIGEIIVRRIDRNGTIKNHCRNR